jgi:hypothetical protein
MKAAMRFDQLTKSGRAYLASETYHWRKLTAVTGGVARLAEAEG